MSFSRPLPHTFYAEDALSVARKLLGHCLVVRSEEGVTGGTIIETEAYCGALDRACHSFRYRRTARTEPMYGPPGSAYVYLVYGIHHCLNVVCLREDEPHAVLIRGLRPTWGLGVMARRRGVPSRANDVPNPRLADGPGKVCEAMGIDLADNGTLLTGGRLMITEERSSGGCIVQGPRVGLGDVGEFRGLPWRFMLTG